MHIFCILDSLCTWYPQNNPWPSVSISVQQAFLHADMTQEYLILLHVFLSCVSITSVFIIASRDTVNESSSLKKSFSLSVFAHDLPFATSYFFNFILRFMVSNAAFCHFHLNLCVLSLLLVSCLGQRLWLLVVEIPSS